MIEEREIKEKQIKQTEKETKKKKYGDLIKERLKMNPDVILEMIKHCAYCGKEIPLDSTEYFITPNYIPFCSIECAYESAEKGKHPLLCGCELCGSPEEVEKVYQEILPEYKNFGLTHTSYVWAEAQKRVRRQKLDEFLEKYLKK